MLLLCFIADIVGTIAFAHTLPTMIYLLPGCLLGVLLPQLEVLKGRFNLLHRLLVPCVIAASLYAIFLLKEDNWRAGMMTFTVVYLTALCMRYLGDRQKLYIKELKEKVEYDALRRARTKVIEELQGTRVRDRVIIRTTYQNEKQYLAVAALFNRYGWNVRVEFLDDFEQGRFRVVYTAPASADVLSRSFRSVRTESFRVSTEGNKSS